MATLTKVQRQILRAIVEAQHRSDCAKWQPWYIDEVVQGANWGPRRTAYDDKLMYIVKALKMLDKTPPFGVSYWLTIEDDQNGFTSVVSYFRIRRPEGNFQVSFHTPWRLADPLIPWIGKGSKTRWNKRIGGSRTDAKELKVVFNL